MSLGKSMKTEQLQDRKILEKRGMMEQPECGGSGEDAW